MINTDNPVLKSVMSPRWKQLRIILMSNDPIKYMLIGLRDDGTMWYKTLTIQPSDIEKMSFTSMMNYLEPKLINAAIGLNQFRDTESPYPNDRPISDEEFEMGIRSTDGMDVRNVEVDGFLRWTVDGFYAE